MSCEINLRFGRFGYGTGQLTGSNGYYIGLPFRKTRRASSVLRPHVRLNLGELLGLATIGPCTITKDLGAIICSMTDRLARAPDADVHVPSVGSPKYPFRSADVVYF